MISSLYITYAQKAKPLFLYLKRPAWPGIRPFSCESWDSSTNPFGRHRLAISHTSLITRADNRSATAPDPCVKYHRLSCRRSARVVRWWKLLARTAKTFQYALDVAIPGDGMKAAHERFRMRVENAIFLQIIVGAERERTGANGRLLRTITTTGSLGGTGR